MNLFNYHSKPELLHFYQELGGKLDENGNILFTTSDGKLHRDGDQPAIIYASGTKTWYKNGQPYRDGDQPAIIYADDTKEWWRNGVRTK